MKNIRKTHLGVAVAAALGAGLLMHDASAVNLATDGVGEVAIAPYYTTRDGWQTLINLTNTRPYPVVVKVRLHESANSRDVFDFNVALSGYDVFVGVISEGAEGPVFLIPASETTCTIPERGVVNGAPLSALGYSGLDDNSQSNLDAGDTTNDRLSEGYVEFLVMGHTGSGRTAVQGLPEVPVAFDPIVTATEAAALAGNDIGDLIEYKSDAACTAVSGAFTKGNILATAQQFGEPINALNFNFRLINVGRGVEAGNTATTWANFYEADQNPSGPGIMGAAGAPENIGLSDDTCVTTRGVHRDGGLLWEPQDGAGGSCPNFMTAQDAYNFLEPSLNDAFPVEGAFIDDTLQALQVMGAGATALSTFGPVGTALTNTIVFEGTRTNEQAGWDNFRGIDAVSATIMRSAVDNEWSSNPTAGVQTDWVVTFPTKYFYVDQGVARQFAIIEDDRPEAQYSDAGDALLVPYPPFAEAFSVLENGDPTNTGTGARIGGESCNRVSFSRFDRSENSSETTGGVIISPAPATATDNLCQEANVITFNGGSVLGAANPVDVDTSSIPGSETSGWMKLRLDEDPASDPTNADPNFVEDDLGNSIPIRGGLGAGTLLAGDDYYGLPAVGYMVKQRTFGDVTANYASSLDHAYERRTDSTPFVAP